MTVAQPARSHQRIVHILPQAAFLFFLDDTPTTEIYTLSLHDALPILSKHLAHNLGNLLYRSSGSAGMPRSEERFSRNAETELVCRLLLEKKKARSSRLLVCGRNTSGS